MHRNPSQGLNGPEALNGLGASPSGHGPHSRRPEAQCRVTWMPPQPVAGAPSTGYDVLSSAPGEAMKKPSRAGGAKNSKARSRRSPRLKRTIQSKATAPRSAATQQLGEWLGILGMSEYAKCFAENDVDLTVLPHLTDHDLKELGVSLGHRRKMLAAIAGRADTVEALYPIIGQIGRAAGLTPRRRSKRSDFACLCAGARHRWGDAESGRPPARGCRTEHGRHRREHAKANASVAS